MTYGEIIDTLNANSRKNQNSLKEKAVMDYRLADLIATHVSRAFDKNVQIPSLYDAYPVLFAREKILQDKEREKAEMEMWKQRMLGFAEAHNRKWGEKH